MNLTLSYYPDINQYKSLDEIRIAVIDFSEALAADYSSKIGQEVTIEVLPIMTVKDQTKAMANGTCAIGLMKPVSYVLSHQANKNIVPASVAWRLINGKEQDTYFAQLYCKRESDIRSLEDVKKYHRIGYGDSFSTSNFLIPAAELLKEGIHPFTNFRKVEFFGGHDLVAKAVYLGETDVGAGHDGVIYLLSQVPGFEDAQEKLQRIKKIDIHSDPVAVNKQLLPDFEMFVQSLTDISSNGEVKGFLEDFWGNVTKLGPTQHENYASIEDAIINLNLTEQNIL